MVAQDERRTNVFLSILGHFLASGKAAKHAALEPHLLSRARRRQGLEEAFVAEEALVSVVIPTFDRFEILHERTIPSLLRQTHKNLEIIIVGDGCPNIVARQQAKNFTRVGAKFYNLRLRTRYPHEAMSRWMVLGTRPMNAGTKRANGDWILFISDDDSLLPDAIKEMLNEAQKSDVEVVFTPTVQADDILVPVGGQRVSNGEIMVEHCFSKVFMMRSYLAFFRWNTASYRKRWNRPADYDLYMRMQHAGVRFAMAPQPGCVIHAVPHSEGRQGSAAEAWLAQRSRGPHNQPDEILAGADAMESNR